MAELPLVDLDVVAELRESTGDDMDFVRELISTYVDESAGNITALEAAMAAGDVAGVVRPSHTLKSSSASIGAMRLSELCRGIEVASREGREAGLPEAVAEVRPTYDETLAALRTEGLA
jgi:HPt (histidine-containing phosphotransfer) domain-containing protein